MSETRKIVIVVFGLGVALCFLRIPWTEDVGYSWLWSRPKPIAIHDIVEEARQHWQTEYEANTSERIAHDLAKSFEDTPSHSYRPMTKEEKADFELRARIALQSAAMREDVLSRRQSMSDEEVISLLKETEDFDDTFPDKAGLDAQSKTGLLTEWEKSVRPLKERNKRIERAKIDFTRIGMELVVLSALLLVGLALTSKHAL